MEALPILLRRIARSIVPTAQLRVNPPIRIKSGSFINDIGYFNRYVNIAAAKAAAGQGHVLILLDCDDDCPVGLGPALLAACGSGLLRCARNDGNGWIIYFAPDPYPANRSGISHSLC